MAKALRRGRHSSQQGCTDNWIVYQILAIYLPKILVLTINTVTQFLDLDFIVMM